MHHQPQHGLRVRRQAGRGARGTDRAGPGRGRTGASERGGLKHTGLSFVTAGRTVIIARRLAVIAIGRR